MMKYGLLGYGSMGILFNAALLIATRYGFHFGPYQWAHAITGVAALVVALVMFTREWLTNQMQK